MAVHSTQLGGGANLSTGATTLYTVPSGKRTIVKSLYLHNRAGSANRVTIIFHSSTLGSVVFAVTPGASSSATESLFQELWAVLNAGDYISVNPASSGMDVLVSGTELSL